MNLQFDSLGEFQDFLKFIGVEKKQTIIGELAVRVAVDATPIKEFVAEYESGPNEHDTPTGLEVQIAAAEPETPKRKRRTKAEIDAGISPAGPGATDSPWPFKEIAELEAARASVPETVVAAQVAGTPMTDHQKPGDETDAKMYIAERVPVIPAALIAPVQHLGICRQFIAAHSMSPYIRSMQLVDGPGEVAAYSDLHRAQHIAAMEYVNKSQGAQPLAHETPAA